MATILTTHTTTSRRVVSGRKITASDLDRSIQPPECIHNGNMRMHCPPIDILKIACTQKWQAEKARSRAYWMNPGVDTRTAWEEAKIAEALAEEDLYMVRILIQQLIDAGEV